jgi:hypothetical protein
MAPLINTSEVKILTANTLDRRCEIHTQALKQIDHFFQTISEFKDDFTVYLSAEQATAAREFGSTLSLWCIATRSKWYNATHGRNVYQGQVNAVGLSASLFTCYLTPNQSHIVISHNAQYMAQIAPFRAALQEAIFPRLILAANIEPEYALYGCRIRFNVEGLRKQNIPPGKSSHAVYCRLHVPLDLASELAVLPAVQVFRP